MRTLFKVIDDGIGMDKERKVTLISSFILKDKELQKVSLANDAGIYTSVTKLPGGKNLLKTYIKANIGNTVE